MKWHSRFGLFISMRPLRHRHAGYAELDVSRIKENPAATQFWTHSLATLIDWLLQGAQAFTKDCR
jgi:hypothetical protein